MTIPLRGSAAAREAGAESVPEGGGRGDGVELREVTPQQREPVLRGRLGLLQIGERLPRRTILWGWLGPLLMTILGGVLRLVNLDHPERIMFDETYYVKDAFTLDRFGFSTKWEPIDEDNPNHYFNQGDHREMTDVPSYVVHGELGKWLIALGMRLFGADNGLGWRFAAAVAGTLMVFLVGRIALRLFRSATLATLTAGLVAIDGIGLTLSRIGLLDVFLALFILLGFWAVLRDRDASRAHMARRYAADDWWQHPKGPGTGFRGWLVLAGVFIGGAAGVKWSGFYAAAVLGLAAWLWDLSARRLLGVRRPVSGSILRGGVPAFLAFVPTTIAAYLASWFSWFTHPGSYMHQWAADLRSSGQHPPRAWMPDTLNSFLQYHLQMYDFHSGLDSEHTYQAHPIGWLLQIRPTLFYWQGYDDVDQQALCGADRCVGVITALGNPFIWWSAALALLLVTWLAVRCRDGRAGIILTGYAATYLPWFLYMNRTVFNFYTITILPFVALALAYAIGIITQRLPLASAWDPEALRSSRRFRFPGLRSGDQHGVRTQRIGIVVSSVVLILAVLATVFWWPIWTGMVVGYEFWHVHTWLLTW
ncbi:MAG TPA: phospholipid carrier-dependent glycosyltransferase [Actinomycetaceae bacterium]|nr:phospholipid carrier-dependent glycosyltransferase [Actinomycetaceae bacterium]